MTDETNPWTFLTSRTAYQNPWIRVEHHEVLRPDGGPGLYGIVRFRFRAVGVLAVEEDGFVHLVGQFRVPLMRYSWEIAEGGAEPGESLEVAARRELEEEIGVRAGRLVPVLKLALSNSVSDEEAWCFLAFDISPGVVAPDETEALAQKRVHFTVLLGDILAGRIDDAITVATALRAHHMAVTGELPAALAQAMLTPLEAP